ncbi:hypothetical protein GC089_15880 [Cellulomonas sp. JZ18]|uniref:hypothetical protein n=1 Tax=Cellulomonas sp. JZ18 TaxID=2654191 RepID=UPI0012D3EA0A|nr:hypothetical protein [Cellulomonas sp. JZ18]QGQ20396.1 hypothetical protein GC089_15880 [Cellulomonas sp. JZ18]
MSTTTWGPALDAELAYRRESVRGALAAGRATRRGARRARAAGARRTTVRAPGRRWGLPGSGAWHAAR